MIQTAISISRAYSSAYLHLTKESRSNNLIEKKILILILAYPTLNLNKTKKNLSTAKKENFCIVSELFEEA